MSVSCFVQVDATQGRGNPRASRVVCPAISSSFHASFAMRHLLRHRSQRRACKCGGCEEEGALDIPSEWAFMFDRESRNATWDELSSRPVSRQAGVGVLSTAMQERGYNATLPRPTLNSSNNPVPLRIIEGPTVPPLHSFASSVTLLAGAHPAQVPTSRSAPPFVCLPAPLPPPWTTTTHRSSATRPVRR